MNQQADPQLDRARSLHERAIVIDTHCDTTQRLLDKDWDFSARHDEGHVDLPRLREGGVDAMVLAVWAPRPATPEDGVATTRKQIDRIVATAQRHKSDMVLARTADDVRRARQEEKFAALIGIEGGYLIGNSLEVLREYGDAGAVYLTLTHAFHTDWADSSGVHEPLEPLHGGLTDFGRDVIGELNRLGMIIDVSHVSDQAFWQVMEITKAPIMASHSSCRAVSPHCRNLSDEMIKAIADAGGVVQINFASSFIDPDYPPLDPVAMERWWSSPAKGRPPLTDYTTPLSLLVDHFDHAMQLVGPAHVGIGSDYDGVPAVPEGVEDCAKLPKLTAELLRRGYSEADLTGVLGENALRVLQAAQNKRD